MLSLFIRRKLPITSLLPAIMFPFDQSALPHLAARKALIAVDFQNEFLSPGKPLFVPEPKGFVERTIQLADALRGSADVVWIQSRFDQVREADRETLAISGGGDDQGPKPPGKVRPSARSARKLLAMHSIEAELEAETPDPEAFLSQNDPQPLSTPEACEMPSVLKDAVKKTDVILTKTHYSAFEGTSLLRFLRAKLVMEVFICGSLANIGVFATALAAAGHGMAITIVEDCCGYRNEGRQSEAIGKLINLTGCEVATLEEVLETVQPKKPTPKGRSSPPSSQPSSRAQTERDSQSPGLSAPMGGLKLASTSPTPDSSQQWMSPVVGNIGQEQDKPPVDPAEEGSNGSSTSAKDDTKHSNDASPKTQTQVKDPIIPDASIAASPPVKDNGLNEPTTAEPEKDGSEEEEDESEEESDIKGLCEGDTDVITKLLPPDLEKDIFDTLCDEISWQRMSHQGGEVPRLVAVQGHVSEDGSMPVYRHPSDESPPLLPFSPTVLKIKAETEKRLGHPLNHALIQLYRDGNDYISEHSDKTLDIVKGSYIANVSLGAQRMMVLRTKRKAKDPSRPSTSSVDNARQVQRAPLPHNSLFRMGLQTNMKWLHSIRQDRRATRDKTSSELAFAGARISLTFRRIGTFLDRDEKLIWGQGATGKTHEDAHAVVNGQTPEAVKMLQAFGTENHASVFDWGAYYGKGFDVLHMSSAPRFFASADEVVNMRIWFMLAEYGVSCAKGSMGPIPAKKPLSNGIPDDVILDSGDVPVKFIDNDAAKSTVNGDMAIMLYIDSCYGPLSSETTPLSKPDQALRFSLFQRGMSLLNRYRRIRSSQDSEPGLALQPLKQELTFWNTQCAAASEHGFLTGPSLSLPDFAVWPVLHTLVQEHSLDALSKFGELKRYYERVALMESAKKVTRKKVDSPAKES